DVYAGGEFTLAGDGSATTERLRLAVFDNEGNLSSRRLDVRMNQGASIRSLAIDEERVFIAGDFTHVNDIQARGVASLSINGVVQDLDNHACISEYRYSSARQTFAYFCNPAPVNALAAHNGYVYMTGEFDSLARGPFPSAGFVSALPVRRGIASITYSGGLREWEPSPVFSGSSLVVAAFMDRS